MRFVAVALFGSVLSAQVIAGDYTCASPYDYGDSLCAQSHWDAYIAEQGGILILESKETKIGSEAPFLGYITVYFGLYGGWGAGPVATAVLESEYGWLLHDNEVEIQRGEMRLYPLEVSLSFDL